MLRFGCEERQKSMPFRVLWWWWCWWVSGDRDDETGEKKESESERIEE